MNADFSWAQAAFAGFEMLRREPRVVLFWSLVSLVLTMTQQVIAVNAEILRNADALSLAALMLGLAGGLISIGTVAIFSAAVYRAVLLPREESRARMRLGRDEVRLALVWLVQMLLMMFPFLALVVPIVMATAATATATATPFVTVAAFLVALLVGGLLVARLSIAAPMSLMEGRWSLPAAWRLTRGRAWKIAGVYLTVLFAVAATYWTWRVLYGLLVHAMGGEFSVAALFEPSTLIFTILSAGLNAAGAAVLYAPAALIYRDLKGETPADQAAVFD